MNYLLRSALLLTFFLQIPLLSGQDGPVPDDWPQWRGPDRLGQWYGGPEVDFLSPGIINTLWDVPVGSGYSGPTVSGGSVYLMDFHNGTERVLCFDAATGRESWTYSYPVAYAVGYPTGPRASVLIHEGKAYSWGTMGHLHCLDAATGRLLWSVNGMKQYQISIPIWGMASHPIVVDDLLIVMMGGKSGSGMVAFQKDSGKEAWRALDEEASYSAPVLIRQAGKRVLVCWTAESITGLDPATGSLFWSIPFQPRRMIMNVADPVYDPPYLFLTGFFDGSYLLRLGQESLTAELVYYRHGESERLTDALHSCISTPFVSNGYIYGIDSYGEVRCLDLLTGDRLWEDHSLVPRGRWANVHFVTQGEKVWGFNERGELLLGQFTPEGYRDLGRVKVIDPVRISPNPRNGVTWAHPAFSGDRIWFRSDSRLVCIGIKSR